MKVVLALLAVFGWFAVEYFVWRAGSEHGPEFLSVTTPEASTAAPEDHIGKIDG